MKIVYEIPEHLGRYLNDFPEKEICKVITSMLELAVRNDLLHFPDTLLERSVKEIRDTVRELRHISSLSAKTTETLLHEILNKLNTPPPTANTLNVSPPMLNTLQEEEVILVKSNISIEESISSEDFLDLIGGL